MMIMNAELWLSQSAVTQLIYCCYGTYCVHKHYCYWHLHSSRLLHSI